MTSYEIRGSLARCLATENLTVEHRSVSTAMFDVDRRVLTLPNWKKASDTVYQMLLLHECGHALFTDNINWKEDYPDTPRDFVNVIEDVLYSNGNHPGLFSRQAKLKAHLSSWPLRRPHHFPQNPKYAR